ncbi:MAG TPA: hypothetical protein PKZ54_09740 [Syntrophorhabdaceae bacterium]|nr:hypothetical protein [Syntrophorhabdaceae bacterium]
MILAIICGGLFPFTFIFALLMCFGGHPVIGGLAIIACHWMYKKVFGK